MAMKKQRSQSLKVLKSLGSNQMVSSYNEISDCLWPVAARTLPNLKRSQNLQFLV